MFAWLGDVIGICLGNTMWLAGMAGLGIGIWIYRVKVDSVKKSVKMMSAFTGGKPRGFAKQLLSLVDPVDRRHEVGRRLVFGGVALILIGCTLVARCAG